MVPPDGADRKYDADGGRILTTRLPSLPLTLGLVPNDDLALLLRLNKSWYDGIPPDELYEITRAWWVMSVANAERVVRVLAVAGGLVREVYEPAEWLHSPVEGLENRIGFNGSVASDRDKYVGRDVAHLFRPGSANPVRYLPLNAVLADSSVTPTGAEPVAAESEPIAHEAVEPGLLERVLPLLDAFEHDLLWAQSRAGQELFHSNTLGWLLRKHPQELRPLLEVLGGATYPDIDAIRVARELKHLDVVVDPVDAHPKVVVENKLYSIPYPAQLLKYNPVALPWSPNHGEAGASNTRYVLLSLMDPSFDLPAPWVHVNYSAVSDALELVDALALGRTADLFTRYRALVQRLVALAEALDPAQALDEPFSALQVVGQLPGGSLDGAIYKTRISGLAQVVQAQLDEPKSFVVEGGRGGCGLISYWRRVAPTRMIGWQYQVIGKQLRYQLTVEDPELQGEKHVTQRAHIAESEFVEFFDHSDLEAILDQDLLPKTYASGQWNRFNPDFVYRHRPVSASISTAKLAAALVAMTRRVDAFADKAGFDVGSRGSVGQ